MKPHLPLPLLRAVLACFAALTTAPFTTTAAETTIPAGYTPVEITDAADFASYYTKSKYAFLLTGDAPLTLTPTDCPWWATGAELFTGKDYFFASQNTDNKISLTFNGGTDGAPSAFRDAGTLEFQGLDDVDFLNLYVKTTTYGDYAQGGAIYANYSSLLTFSGNGNITFSGNYATSTADRAQGGAIYANFSSSPLTFSENGNITFSGNYVTSMVNPAEGGAIYVSDNAHATFSGNGCIIFSENHATSLGSSGTYGGAIFSASYYKPLIFSTNTKIIFSENHASGGGGGGGAIYGRSLRFDMNGDITFNANYLTAGTSVAHGGAIYAFGTQLFSGNKNIVFDGNHINSVNDAGGGGAIHASDSLTFSGNETISFRENYVSTMKGASGGAINISTTAPLTFSENHTIEFYGNNTSSQAGTAYGGALNASSISSNLTLIGNRSISFRENYAFSQTGTAYGGAICMSSGSTFILRGEALFERNYEVEKGVYRLRSVYLRGGSGAPSTMELSAPTGGNVEFYDGIYADSNVTVTLNKDYDVDGVTQKADGDILLSGATIEEISNSLTSELRGTVTLYGGRLRVEDGVKLTVGSFSTAAGSNATLLLKDASVTGYSSTSTLSLSDGSTLALQGVNTITAKSLTLEGGSAISFILGIENADTALLTLGSGTILNTDALTLNLSGTGLAAGSYKLITLADSNKQYDDTLWTAGNVTVSGLGVNFDNLMWDQGTLYLDYSGTSSTDPDIPKGYTSVIITKAADFSPWYNKSKIAFLLAGSDPTQPIILTPTNCTWWATGAELFTGKNYLFTSKDTETKISLTFDGEEAGAPSAFREAGTLEFQGLGDVDFLKLYIKATASGASVSAWGGAIYATSALTFSDNRDIGFRGNYASSTAYSACGGAIYTDSALTFSGNGDICFSGNYALFSSSSSTTGGLSAWGGAIFSLSSLSFSGNENITFSGNYAASPTYSAFGGAIYVCSSHSLIFSGNKDIVFSGNHVTSKGPEARGGAIDAYSTPLTFSGNGNITFSGNYAFSQTGTAYGGAIYVSSGSTFILRGEALFERNYEVEKGVYRLRSVYQQASSTSSRTMELSAPTGQKIEFYDGVYADSNVMVT